MLAVEDILEFIDYHTKSMIEGAQINKSKYTALTLYVVVYGQRCCAFE